MRREMRIITWISNAKRKTNFNNPEETENKNLAIGASADSKNNNDTLYVDEHLCCASPGCLLSALCLFHSVTCWNLDKFSSFWRLVCQQSLRRWNSNFNELWVPMLRHCQQLRMLGHLFSTNTSYYLPPACLWLCSFLDGGSICSLVSAARCRAIFKFVSRCICKWATKPSLFFELIGMPNSKLYFITLRCVVFPSPAWLLLFCRVSFEQNHPACHSGASDLKRQSSSMQRPQSLQVRLRVF